MSVCLLKKNFHSVIVGPFSKITICISWSWPFFWPCTLNDDPPLAIPCLADSLILVHEFFDILNPRHFGISAFLSGVVTNAIETWLVYTQILNPQFFSTSWQELWNLFHRFHFHSISAVSNRTIFSWVRMLLLLQWWQYFTIQSQPLNQIQLLNGILASSDLLCKTTSFCGKCSSISYFDVFIPVLWKQSKIAVTKKFKKFSCMDFLKMGEKTEESIV